ncbi:hypothetical protein BJ166DRAFT_506184 [Pestalotiopsis sp. NC0098]|nr:hypothetical protein BJ166DRAFT_506184 [Pestalotiopsis sp. NC0098]
MDTRGHVAFPVTPARSVAALRLLVVTALGEDFVVSHALERKKHYDTFAATSTAIGGDECLDAHVFDFGDKTGTHRRFLEKRIAPKLLKSDKFVREYRGASYLIVASRQRTDRPATSKLQLLTRVFIAAEDDPTDQIGPARVDPVKLITRLCCRGQNWANKSKEVEELDLPLCWITIKLAEETDDSLWLLSASESDDSDDNSQIPTPRGGGPYSHEELTICRKIWKGGFHHCQCYRRRRKRPTPTDRKRHFVLNLASLLANDEPSDMNESGRTFCMRYLTLPSLDIIEIARNVRSSMGEKADCWPRFVQNMQRQLPQLLKAVTSEQKRIWNSSLPTIMAIFESLPEINTVQGPSHVSDHPPSTRRRRGLGTDVHGTRTTEQQQWTKYLGHMMPYTFTQARATVVQRAMELWPLGDGRPDDDGAWHEILTWLGMIKLHHEMYVWSTARRSAGSRQQPYKKELKRMVRTYSTYQMVIGMKPVIERMARLARQVEIHWDTAHDCHTESELQGKQRDQDNRETPQNLQDNCPGDRMQAQEPVDSTAQHAAEVKNHDSASRPAGRDDFWWFDGMMSSPCLIFPCG